MPKLQDKIFKFIKQKYLNSIYNNWINNFENQSVNRLEKTINQANKTNI